MLSIYLDDGIGKRSLYGPQYHNHLGPFQKEWQFVNLVGNFYQRRIFHFN